MESVPNTVVAGNHDNPRRLSAVSPVFDLAGVHLQTAVRAPADGGVLAKAGLYDFWRDSTRADDDPLAWLMTATVLTTTAEDAVGMIHDRMPLLVESDRWAQWLDPAYDGSTGDPRGLLVPAAPGRLDAYPVSTAVNAVRNNGPELVEPIAAEGAPEPDGADDSTLF